uniref:Uncharacterized protein n=1 Tax=Kwoniella pini CBS 10737 TaxID=1296096 RepID=A0A1B9HVT7_9TREE|nr:uncharacterized protein I206_06276 [Kwoniella pini CBS 10737]OCF47380.1 hypothetical protein I206_06276 [Kwoniella pini CBS 10737]
MSTVSRTQGAPSVTGNFRFGSIHVHHLPVPGEGPVVSVSSASGPSSESIPEKPVMTVGVSRVEEVEQRFFRSKLPETWTVEDQLNLSRFNQSLKKLTSSSCCGWLISDVCCYLRGFARNRPQERALQNPFLTDLKQESNKNIQVLKLRQTWNMNSPVTYSSHVWNSNQATH